MKKIMIFTVFMSFFCITVNGKGQKLPIREVSIDFKIRYRGNGEPENDTIYILLKSYFREIFPEFAASGIKTCSIESVLLNSLERKNDIMIQDITRWHILLERNMNLSFEKRIKMALSVMNLSNGEKHNLCFGFAALFSKNVIKSDEMFETYKVLFEDEPIKTIANKNPDFIVIKFESGKEIQISADFSEKRAMRAALLDVFIDKIFDFLDCEKSAKEDIFSQQ